jgi:hypothetical protein
MIAVERDVRKREFALRIRLNLPLEMRHRICDFHGSALDRRLRRIQHGSANHSG